MGTQPERPRTVVETVTLRAPRWRLVAVRAAVSVLCGVESVWPGAVDEDRWTDRLARFVVRGMTVVG